jgi:hypothetical protein
MRLTCARPSRPPATHSPTTRHFSRTFLLPAPEGGAGLGRGTPDRPAALNTTPYLNRRGRSETECRARTLYQHGRDCPAAHAR